jgi:hypothetical protein
MMVADRLAIAGPRLAAGVGWPVGNSAIAAGGAAFLVALARMAIGRQ